jgi:hypothetical protein
MDFYALPADEAMKAYRELTAEGKTPSLTDQLLYAILAQLGKLNEQISVLTDKKS